MVANTVVHPTGVPVATPSFTSSLQNRILSGCIDITAVGMEWIFHFRPESGTQKLHFLKVADYLLCHWYDWPLMQPLVRWMANHGLPVVPQERLTLSGLEQGINDLLQGASSLETKRLCFLLERLARCQT